MEVERRLVLDANILIRAVLGRRVREIIAEHAGAAAFFASEVAFEDALRYLPTLLEKRGVAAEPALTVLERLGGIVHAVGEETYSPLRRTALARIEQRDPDDWPILATAIVLQCPIWTEDQDFFGTGVPTWTTDRVEIYLASDG